MSSSQFDVETALHPKVILDILVKAAQGVFHAREILPERRVPSRTVKILRDGGVEPDTLIVNAYDYKSMITKDAKIRELARSTGKALDDIIPMLFPRLEIIKTSVKDTLGNYLLDDYAIVLARGSETGNIFVASPLEVIRVENELKRGWDYAVYYDALPVLTRPKRVCRIKNTKA